MRQLTREQIEDATISHATIESIVIHADGMTIAGVGSNEMVECEVRHWLRSEIEGMGHSERSILFIKTLAPDMHVC